MESPQLAALLATQAGMVSRRQLNALGLDHNFVRHQVDARRWVVRTPLVISTTTGEPTWVQRAWTGILHAGPGCAVGGLSAAKIQRLRNWERHEITILVRDSADIAPVDGIDFVRTRRDLEAMKLPGTRAPVCRIEPAVLLFAGYTRSPRTACGVLAAVVQQRLTTPDSLLLWLDMMRPLRRAKLFRTTLGDIAGGAQSHAEIDIGALCRRNRLPLPDRQVRRRDARGVLRYTDCEWRLPDGRVVVLEVDGGFHMEVEHWVADMSRERGLVVEGSTVLRCTTFELRRDPAAIARDLRSVGVGHPPTSGRVGEASV
ncbi:MAG TPA: hypothetical protein VK204_11055 [Nocardioidaceae bacterium]|nr:hypothetical protein [Nocardioidaceae bacterium]